MDYNISDVETLKSLALDQRRKALNACSHVDLLIVGGGVHGAFAAREAAARGLSVMLLEARDFASGTSSRSSKLLHGGLRYLEQGNLRLVYEGLRERRRFQTIAPHLSRTQQFVMPIVPLLGKPRGLVAAGVTLYRALAGELGSRTTPALESTTLQALQQLGLPATAIVSYFDGQMDDTRLVIEAIVDARELGAITLNHAPLTALHRESSSCGTHGFIGRFTDAVLGTEQEVRSRFVLNVSGPWIQQFHRDVFKDEPWRAEWPAPVFSRGTHLVFDREWQLPALILPTGEKGRYYFVLPYFNAERPSTLVGTTDHLLDGNEENPQPSEAEIQQLLCYLQRDFPEGGFDRSGVCRSWAGVRILAEVTSAKSVSAISRSDYILEAPGYLGLLGGKFTTACRTAEKLVARVRKHLGLPEGRGVGVRRLPGAGLRPANLTLEECAAFQRFGSRLEQITGGQTLSPADLLHRQVVYAILTEQAFTVEDVWLRRFSAKNDAEPASNVHASIGNLINGLAVIAENNSAHFPQFAE